MAAFLGALTFTDEPVGEAPPRLDTEPLVVRSLRLPVEVELRAHTIAKERGVPVTALMREWITVGLATAEGRATDDPVADLGRILTEANRAYHAMTHQK
jgi:chromosomal replication initiator protein